MDLTVLKAKIHTVKVTEANLHYRGSITIDEDLMDKAGIKRYEQVHINNSTRSSRIITYAIPGERGSGDICMNGGAALHASEGDVVHLLVYCNIPADQIDDHEPIIIQTMGRNQFAGYGHH
jgi:aspartate 1-decarboxylase